MTSGTSQTHFFSNLPDRTDRPRKTVAAICLGVSFVLHSIAIVLVLVAYTHRSPVTSVTYVDINTAATAAAPPMMQSPPRLKDTSEKSVPEPLPVATKQEAPAESSQSAVQEIQTSQLGRGMMHGYFSSFAEGKNLRDDLREYYLMLLEKINERWWVKSGTLSENAVHDAVVVFMIGKNGEITDLAMRRSTGSRLVDRAIIETIREMVPFPPLPNSFTLDGFLVPLKIAAPLRLFR